MSVNLPGNYNNFLIQQPANPTVAATQQYQAEGSDVMSMEGSLFNAVANNEYLSQVIDTQVQSIEINTNDFLANNASILKDLEVIGINPENVSVQKFGAKEIAGGVEGQNGTIYGVTYTDQDKGTTVTQFYTMTAAGPSMIARQIDNENISETQIFNEAGDEIVASTKDLKTGTETIERHNDAQELTQRTEIKGQGRSVTTNYENGKPVSTVEQNGTTTTTKNADGQITERTINQGSVIIQESYVYLEDGTGVGYINVNNGAIEGTFDIDSEGNALTNVKDRETPAKLLERLGIEANEANLAQLDSQTTSYKTDSGNTVKGFQVGQQIKLSSFLISQMRNPENIDVDADAEKAKQANDAIRNADTSAYTDDNVETTTVKSGDTWYGIAEQNLKDCGIENPSKEQISARSNELQQINGSDLQAGSEITVMKTDATKASEKATAAEEQQHAEELHTSRQSAQEIADELHDDIYRCTLNGSTLSDLVLKKITPDNVEDVIMQYRGNSSSESLLEAIYDEKFRLSQSDRKKLINHISNCLVQKAESMGIDPKQLSNNAGRAGAIAGTVGHMFNYEGYDVPMESVATAIRMMEEIPPAQQKAIQKIYSENPGVFHEMTVNDMTDNLNEAKTALKEYTDDEGFIGKTADAVSALWGSENRLSNVEGKLADYEALINELGDASAEDFPAKFKAKFGVDYNPSLVASYKQHQEQFAYAASIKYEGEQFDATFKDLLREPVLKPKTECIDGQKCPEGYKASEDGYYYEADKEGVLQNQLGRFADYLGNGDREAGMAFFENIEGWNEMDVDQKYQTLRTLAQSYQNNFKEMLNVATDGKGFNTFKAENDVAFQAAYGSGPNATMMQTVDNYVHSQHVAENVIKGTGKFVAMVGMSLIPGLGPVGAAALGAALFTGVDLADAASSNTGLTWSKTGNIIKENGIELGETLLTAGFSKFTGGISNKLLREGANILFEAGLSTGVTYAQTGELRRDILLKNFLAAAAGRVVSNVTEGGINSVKNMRNHGTPATSGSTPASSGSGTAQTNTASTSTAADPPRVRGSKHMTKSEKALARERIIAERTRQANAATSTSPATDIHTPHLRVKGAKPNVDIKAQISAPKAPSAKTHAKINEFKNALAKTGGKFTPNNKSLMGDLAKSMVNDYADSMTPEEIEMLNGIVQDSPGIVQDSPGFVDSNIDSNPEQQNIIYAQNIQALEAIISKYAA